jgi:hypothetical protein
MSPDVPAGGSMAVERNDIAAPTLLSFNRRYDRLVVPAEVSEAIIEGLLADLLGIDAVPSVAQYWLLMARLAEMTLLCAGHYADNAELDLACRLLISDHQNRGRAVFPFLCNQLRNSGRISNLYLVGLRARLEVVFETLQFFRDCRILNSETLWKLYWQGTQANRDAIDIQKSCLTTELYVAMGKEFLQIRQNADRLSTFLKYPTVG